MGNAEDMGGNPVFGLSLIVQCIVCRFAFRARLVLLSTLGRTSRISFASVVSFRLTCLTPTDILTSFQGFSEERETSSTQEGSDRALENYVQLAMNSEERVTSPLS